MDTLYGATVDSVVRKKGERQCIGFAAGFIDDAFTPHGEKLLEPVAELMGEMLLEPVTRNGSFLAEYVDSERANLIDASQARCATTSGTGRRSGSCRMCAGEPYNILRLGERGVGGTAEPPRPVPPQRRAAGRQPGGGDLLRQRGAAAGGGCGAVGAGSSAQKVPRRPCPPWSSCRPGRRPGW